MTEGGPAFQSDPEFYYVLYYVLKNASPRSPFLEGVLSHSATTSSPAHRLLLRYLSSPAAHAYCTPSCLQPSSPSGSRRRVVLVCTSPYDDTIKTVFVHIMVSGHYA